ncbi:MAG: NAD(P)-dependent oxidoreductase [Candidatus Hydrogenedentota bacterium]
MKKLLVTGGGGFLGWNLVQTAGRDWEVYATVHSRRIELDGATVEKVDLTDYRALKEMFSSIKPDAMIHTAAASQPNYCQEHRSESQKINVDAALNIAGLCADRGIALAFCSTDLVFDGTRSPYRESDPVSPVSYYAEQKVEAEKGIMERYPRAAVSRMPLMFGDPGPVATSFIQPFLKSMRAGQELRLFMDEFRTPVSGRVASQGLLLALAKVNGLIHLGGRERISRHDFGLMLASRLEIVSADIKPCRQKDVPMAAPRPPDVALDSARAYALGYDPPSLVDQIMELKGRI